MIRCKWRVRNFLAQLRYWDTGMTWSEAGRQVMMDHIAESLSRRVSPAVWRFHRPR